MHRFFLPSTECRGSSIQLDEAESRHAATVLRVQVGEGVTVLDGEGSVFRCEVIEVRKKSVRLVVRDRESVPPLPYRVTLLQGLPKGKLIESIVQKATELGVHRVVPLLTDRVTVQLEGDRLADKAEKWRRVAIEAIKQSGCAWLPRIETPMTPAEFLGRQEVFDLPLIASLQPGRRQARECFREFAGRVRRNPAYGTIWVVPEVACPAANGRWGMCGGVHPRSL